MICYVYKSATQPETEETDKIMIILIIIVSDSNVVQYV